MTIETDVYAGLTIGDIASAVATWPEGSADQREALDALVARAGPGIGHNSAPLGETLDEELAAYRKRRDELVAVAKTARIENAEDATKVLDLVALCQTLETEVEEFRKARSRPLREAVQTIKARCDAVITPVAIVRHGTTGRDGLRGLLTAYSDQQEAKAEAERQRAREEQRRRDEEAAAARRRADEAAAAGKSTVVADLARMSAEEDAERARQRAEAIRPEPIRSHAGQVGRRRVHAYAVDDVERAVAWILADQGRRAKLLSSVDNIVDQHLRSLGIEVVARGVDIPGCRVWIERGAVNVRR